MCEEPLDLLKLETEVVLSVNYSEGLWLNANLLLTGIRLLVGKTKCRVQLET